MERGQPVVERQVEAGTAAIVSVGTTGESSTLSVLEHTEVMRRTIEVANGRVPVIAGTGANSTAEAIHLTRAARAAGVPVVAAALHSTGWPDGVGRLNRMLTSITDAFIAVAEPHGRWRSSCPPRIRSP